MDDYFMDGYFMDDHFTLLVNGYQTSFPKSV